MRKALSTLLLASCVVAIARADIGPPPGKKLIPVTTTVEAIEDYPDYAFFATSYSSTPGPPPHGGSSRSVTHHFFVNGTTIHATGAPRSGGALYGVPRHVAEGMPGWKDFAADAAKQNPPKHWTVGASDDAWFALAQRIRAGEIPGAISIRFGSNEEVPISDSRTAISEHYCIARTPAGVSFVSPEKEVPLGEVGKCGNEGPEDSIPWKWVGGRETGWVAIIIAGAAASLAMVLGGVWLIRRFSRGTV